ncbi:MAG: DNA alkylation repair protein [Thiotrichaceae bacterium]|nr:DNA alkylation repair protein [Thiotrichaceae bacterium]
MTKINELKQKLKQLADPINQQQAQRFFKTGKGEYAEGDIFLGIRTPVLRKLAAQYQDLSIDECENLLHSPIHEHRSLALMLWVAQFPKADKAQQQQLFERYLRNSPFINNWDLVDISAPTLVGKYLLEKNREILYKLVASEFLWERRIAVVATLTFIRQQQFDEILDFAKLLLNEPHDLIHKAVGWMLREVGKQNLSILVAFIHEYDTRLPRTTLRYAIEHFDEERRQFHLKRKKSC